MHWNSNKFVVPMPNNSNEPALRTQCRKSGVEMWKFAICIAASREQRMKMISYNGDGGRKKRGSRHKDFEIGWINLILFRVSECSVICMVEKSYQEKERERDRERRHRCDWKWNCLRCYVGCVFLSPSLCVYEAENGNRKIRLRQKANIQTATS